MKTLFDEEPRYAITPTGTTWKLEGGVMYWRPSRGVVWRRDIYGPELFQRWIDHRAIREVSGEVYH